MSRIVVGVDGSEGSEQALQWAAREASLRGATLDVIHAYDGSPASMESISSAEQAERVFNAPRESAEALVASLVEGLGDVEVEAHAIESHNPAHTLVEKSKSADMLVVSSRGLGGFKSLILGSVSQQCAQHAECPVVIIRSRVEGRTPSP